MHVNNFQQGRCDVGAFDFDAAVTNSVMQYNYSHDNDGPAWLNYADASNNIIRYNISVNDDLTGAAGGAFVFNQNGAPAGPSQFYNNTIIGPRAAVAICAYSYAPGTTITNNLFVTTDVDVYGRWFAAIICPGSDFSNVSIDNNLYFNLVSTNPGFCTGGDCL